MSLPRPLTTVYLAASLRTCCKSIVISTLLSDQDIPCFEYFASVQAEVLAIGLDTRIVPCLRWQR